MNRYSQNLTLLDIFNNQELKDKLPLINYKETEQDNGKTSRTTNAQTVNTLVFNVSSKASRPYYKPLNATRSGDTMVMGGTLIGDHDEAVDAVYNALLGNAQLLSFTANNADMIRDAIKESSKNKSKYSINSKLYLKEQSIQQIKGMTKKELLKFMNEIMENIIYGDDFPQTQKKWNVEKVQKGFFRSYEQRRRDWKRKVGY